MKILKELRKLNKRTQDQMAKMLGISQQAYATYENDIAKPPLDILNKLADYFKVSTDYLLERDEENKIPPVPMEQTGIEGGYLHIAKEFQGMGLSEKDLKALMDMAKLLEEKNKEIK